jgi:hypothetical protein
VQEVFVVTGEVHFELRFKAVACLIKHRVELERLIAQAQGTATATLFVSPGIQV